jgi:hypothetical protein
MMKHIVILLLMLLSVVTGAFADDNGLDRSVNIVSLPKWTYQNLFTFLGSRPGYNVTISSNALNNAIIGQHGEIGFGGAFNDITVREALSWSLRFAGTSASITNSTLTISSGGSAASLPKVLQIAVESQNELKPIPSIVSLKDDEWDFYQLLEFLSNKADFDNFVIAPAITTNRITVRVAFEDTPIEDALAESLKKVGGLQEVHGNVIYFTLKEENPTNACTLRATARK